MSHRLFWLSLTGLALAGSATAFAGAAATDSSDSGRPPRHPAGPPRHPPEEAVSACADLTDGDECSFTLHDRRLEGECRAAPDDAADTRLACLPSPPPPPPEAVSACAKLSEGDACSVQFDDHTIQGTCAAGRTQSDPLACRPDPPLGSPSAN